MSEKIIAVTQARTGSTRLPGKVLLPLGRSTVLGVHLQRVSRAKRIDKLIVATTEKETDQAVVEIAEALHIQVFRGSEDDVLDRYYQAIRGEECDYVVRITSDCPLIDPDLIDQVIDFTVRGGFDYGSNHLKCQFPDGQDVEVFTKTALEQAWRNASGEQREHVTPYLYEESDLRGESMFTAGQYFLPHDFPYLRMTLDYDSDYTTIKDLVDALGEDVGWQAYVQKLGGEAG